MAAPHQSADGGGSPTDASRSARLGVEPIEPIVVMENHDDAYHAWARAGFKDRILVHVDAHLDFDWIADHDPGELLEAGSLDEVEQLLAGTSRWNLVGRAPEQLIHIGNYLYPTLQQGLVRQLYWVVPDRVLESRKQRQAVAGLFERIKRRNPDHVESPRWSGGQLLTGLCGTEVTVCRLADLFEIAEPVLLNVDVDYLVIGNFLDPYPYADPRGEMPWIWPDELVRRLRERRLVSDFLTIAYSVRGGYTPLALKFLGDDFAGLLAEPATSPRRSELIEWKRSALRARQRGALDDAVTSLERALALAPEDPSVHYNLAELFYERGSAVPAAEHYRHAVRLDPAYRLTEEHLSPVFQRWGMLERAKAEYRKVLVFDPTSADAHAGLAGLLAHQRDWRGAVSLYRKALELEPLHAGAHYNLGYICAKQGRWAAAEHHLAQALGESEYEGLARFWLGYVFKKTRRWDEAIEAYQAAQRLAIRNLSLHWSLGGLYLRAGRIFRSLRQFRRAVRMLPSLPLVLLRRTAGRARNFARRIASGGARFR